MKYCLNEILEKAKQFEPVSVSEMKWILGLSEPSDIEKVFKAARKVRRRYFGNRVFLYGFVYFSTYCRNSCNFCLYRKGNPAAVRYRKSIAQIVESSRRLAQSGVHLIDLTMGEDPQIFEAGEEGFQALLDTVRAVKQHTNLPVMVSAGVISEDVLGKLSGTGVQWYACYQETHNRTLYDKLRKMQDYDIRMSSKQTAKEKGLLIEEGILVGVGESAADIADSITAMGKLGANQVRAMSFIPQRSTPMEHFKPPGLSRELLVIALLRLIFPDRLIPASLDVGGSAALGQKLSAGANVVTSLIPPGQGLAGVAQYDLDIEEGKRTAAGIETILKDNELEAATAEEYQLWVQQRLKGDSSLISAGIA